MTTREIVESELDYWSGGGNSAGTLMECLRVPRGENVPAD
jgi:hypothetical protein